MVVNGERRFQKIGCAACHISLLPLGNRGSAYTEPNPYNPRGNMRPGDAAILAVDLTSDQLPQPRLRRPDGIVLVKQNQVLPPAMRTSSFSPTRFTKKSTQTAFLCSAR